MSVIYGQNFLQSQVFDPFVRTIPTGSFCIQTRPVSASQHHSQCISSWHHVTLISPFVLAIQIICSLQIKPHRRSPIPSTSSLTLIQPSTPTPTPSLTSHLKNTISSPHKSKTTTCRQNNQQSTSCTPPPPAHHLHHSFLRPQALPPCSLLRFPESMVCFGALLCLWR